MHPAKKVHLELRLKDQKSHLNQTDQFKPRVHIFPGRCLDLFDCSRLAIRWKIRRDPPHHFEQTFPASATALQLGSSVQRPQPILTFKEHTVCVCVALRKSRTKAKITIKGLTDSKRSNFHQKPGLVRFFQSHLFQE